MERMRLAAHKEPASWPQLAREAGKYKPHGVIRGAFLRPARERLFIKLLDDVFRSLKLDETNDLEFNLIFFDFNRVLFGAKVLRSIRINPFPL